MDEMKKKMAAGMALMDQGLTMMRECCGEDEHEDIEEEPEMIESKRGRRRIFTKAKKETEDA